MTKNLNLFSREDVIGQVRERLNELWQALVSDTDWGLKDISPRTVMRSEVIEATRTLKGELKNKLMEIAHAYGVYGEHLDPNEFIREADAVFASRVLPESKRLDCPPRNPIYPSADPNWLMKECMVDIWRKKFLEPQRVNTKKMLAGIFAAKDSDPEAVDKADQLMNQLRSSTLERFNRATPDLLQAVIEFLEIYMPDEHGAGNQPGRWLKVSEAAQICGGNTGDITKAVDSGNLKSNGKTGRDRRIDGIDFNRWQLERSKRPERPGGIGNVTRQAEEELRRQGRQK